MSAILDKVENPHQAWSGNPTLFLAQLDVEQPMYGESIYKTYFDWLLGSTQEVATDVVPKNRAVCSTSENRLYWVPVRKHGVLDTELTWFPRGKG